MTGALLLSACASAAQSAQVDVNPDQAEAGTVTMENEAVGGTNAADNPDTDTGFPGQS